MKIQFDIDYDNALLMRAHLAINKAVFGDLAEDLIDSLTNAIDAEEERGWMQMQERLMESGGVDDSKYREDMKDAGRGHLLQ